MAHKRIAVLATLILLFSAHIVDAATIQLPRTGQTVCSDTAGVETACAGTGQDGMYRKGFPWTVPRFTITYCDAAGPCPSQVSDCDANAATDIIKDNLTGLVWVRNAGYTQRTWQESLAYANDLVLCGQNDWRLPNVNELLSLRNEGVDRTDLWLEEQGFAEMSSGYYQTSTAVAQTPANVWCLDIGFGSTGYAARNNPQYAIPVRGPDALGSAPVWMTGQTLCYGAAGDEIACAGTGQDGDHQAGVTWPSPRFTVGQAAEADCITDELTGLMWVRTPNDSFRDWQGGLTYANTLSLCGYDDWRMPNIIEQRSLFNFDGSSADWLNSQGFSAVLSDRFWTSTTYVESPTDAMCGDTYDGYITNFSKVSSCCYAWAVRAGGGSFGTIGTELNVTGKGFGAKKGKVLIGGIAAKIAKDGWTPTSIICQVKKPLSTGPYDLEVIPKDPKGAAPIPMAGAFTIMAPQIVTVDPVSGSPGVPIVLSGNYFGSKKGKVYLEDPGTGMKKNCKITYWYMDPTTGESKVNFIVPKPKGYLSGVSTPYTLNIANKVGTGNKTFTVD